MHKISETDLHLLTVNLRKKFNGGYQLDEYSLDQFGTDVDAVGRGAANGLTFGTADNIAAGLDTGVGKLGNALGQNWGASDYKTNLQNQQAHTAYSKNKSSTTPSWQGADSIPAWVPLVGKGQHNINMHDVGDFAGMLGGGYAIASKVGSAVARGATKSALTKAGVDVTQGVGKYAVPGAGVAGDVTAQIGAGTAAGAGKEALDKALSGMAQWQIDKLMSYPPAKIQRLQQNLNLQYGTNIPVTGKIDAVLIDILVNNKIAINEESREKSMKTKSQIILENKVKSLRETMIKVSEISLPKSKVPEPRGEPHMTEPRFSATHDAPFTTSVDDLMREPPLSNPASEARAAVLAAQNAELERAIAAAKAARAISPAEQAQLDQLKRLKGEQRKQAILGFMKSIVTDPVKATGTFAGILLLYYTVTTGSRVASIMDALANKGLDTIDPSKVVTPAPVVPAPVVPAPVVPAPVVPAPVVPLNPADEEARYQAWKKKNVGAN
jgi:hypothetical protein